MKQRSSNIRSFKTLVSDSKNNMLIILMNWSDIVGKGNSGIMIPLQLKQKTLTIAIPNNMVLSVAAKFTPLIIKRANLCFEDENVKKLKFLIEPGLFKKPKTEKATAEKTKTVKAAREISKEEIFQKKHELIERFGMGEAFSESAAKIELLNMKRGDND